MKRSKKKNNKKNTMSVVGRISLRIILFFVVNLPELWELGRNIHYEPAHLQEFHLDNFLRLPHHRAKVHDLEILFKHQRNWHMQDNNEYNLPCTRSLLR